MRVPSVVWLLVAAAVAGGCKRRAAVAGRDGGAAAAAAGDAASLAPTADAAPGPTTPPLGAATVGVQVLGLEYEGYEARGLPAIRADGAQIAVVSVGDDGGRGFLDLRFQVLDTASGKLVEDRVLVDPDETNQALSAAGDAIVDEALQDVVRQRVAGANAFLAAASWRPLTASLADPGDHDAPVVAGGVAWSLDDRLRLIGRRGGKQVFERGYAQLTGKRAPAPAADDDMCPELVVLDGLHLDESTGKLLVSFGRESGHNCGAAGADLAVIDLPR